MSEDVKCLDRVHRHRPRAGPIVAQSFDYSKRPLRQHYPGVLYKHFTPKPQTVERDWFIEMIHFKFAALLQLILTKFFELIGRVTMST